MSFNIATYVIAIVYLKMHLYKYNITFESTPTAVRASALLTQVLSCLALMRKLLSMNFSWHDAYRWSYHLLFREVLIKF